MAQYYELSICRIKTKHQSQFTTLLPKSLGAKCHTFANLFQGKLVLINKVELEFLIASYGNFVFEGPTFIYNNR